MIDKELSELEAQKDKKRQVIEKLLEIRQCLEEKRRIEAKGEITDKEVREVVEKGSKYVKEYGKMGIIGRMQEAVDMKRLGECEGIRI